MAQIRNEKSILEMCRNYPFITSFLNAWQDRGSLYLLVTSFMDAVKIDTEIKPARIFSR